MNTLEDTLAAFGPAPTGAPPGPPDPTVGLDPLGAAIETLQRFGSMTPQQAAPPAPPPMPVGPAAPQPPVGIIPPEGLGPLQPTAPQGPEGMGAAAPQAQPSPQFTPPKPPGTLDQANALESSAISDVGQTAYTAADAKLKAQRAREGAIADVQMRSANLTEELQNATILNRKRIQAEADLETAGWIQDLQDHSKREPNPSRWWENQSRLGKALWAIGLVFGAAHSAITPGARNAAMETVRAEMNADMEEQRQRLGRELSALKMKGETMRERQARNASDLRDDYAYGLTRIEALERAFMARATVPGDLDAQAVKAEAQAAFAQLKLPYVEGYRKEKLAEKQAAEARAHERRMLGAKQHFERQERIATQEYTTKRDEQKFKYDLALSPVSVGGSYTPGGEIPRDKNGLPLLAEMQGGKAAGVYLKGPDGKPLAYAPRFKEEKDMQAAGEVVEKANTRYTASTKLLNILEGMDGSTLEALKQGILGTTNPALADVVNQLGYEIAKSHDARVTNQDFSKGVSQAMGFDPDGNWLSRGKFVANVDEIKAKLRADINAMPSKVQEQFRKYNNAAINGQGTELVWDPNMLAGEEAPPERSSYEVTGKAPPAPEPVKDIKDYQTRRGQAAADPEQKFNLPDHDAGVVNKVINETTNRGPSSVQAAAEKVLIDLRDKERALTKRMQADPNDPWGTPMSEAEQSKAITELNRLRATREIVESVASDAKGKAASRVKNVEGKIRVLSHADFVTDDWVRKQAAEAGLGADKEEIDKLVRLSQELRKKWGRQ